MAAELWCYTLLQNKAHARVTTVRLSENTVKVFLGSVVYEVDHNQKGENHNQLIAVDGFILPDGLAESGKPLTYRYSFRQNQALKEGQEKIRLLENKSTVKKLDWYGMRPFWAQDDHYTLSDEATAITTVFRLFLSIPAGKEPKHSLACQLKPRSLARRYILIKTSYEGVEFITANSYK